MTASISSPPRPGGFTFKQFFVGHDRCGMKVSTDGVLLGAWAPLPSLPRLLDIGTGSGLLALMLAQRLSVNFATFTIDAIDIDPLAVEQAKENVAQSPWASQILVRQQDFLTYQPPARDRYGLIVCNPPYFQHGQSFRDEQREKARDSRLLDHRALLQHAARFLAADGYFSLILSRLEAEQFADYAQSEGWFLYQQCDIVERESSLSKRRLFTWRRQCCSQQRSRLVIRNEQGAYSTEFRHLTDDFYLAF